MDAYAGHVVKAILSFNETLEDAEVTKPHMVRSLILTTCSVAAYLVPKEKRSWDADSDDEDADILPFMNRKSGLSYQPETMREDEPNGTIEQEDAFMHFMEECTNKHAWFSTQSARNMMLVRRPFLAALLRGRRIPQNKYEKEIARLMCERSWAKGEMDDDVRKAHLEETASGMGQVNQDLGGMELAPVQ